MVRKKVTFALLIFLVSLCFLFSFSGCAKKPATVSDEGAVSEEVKVEEGESVIKEALGQEPDYHVVKKGECLWWIAEYADIYNDPFMWPMIYSANKDQIKNPDLIYPNQEFKIPRAGYSLDEVKEFRRSAGAPRPYTPPADANYSL